MSRKKGTQTETMVTGKRQSLAEMVNSVMPKTDCVVLGSWVHDGQLSNHGRWVSFPFPSFLPRKPEERILYTRRGEEQRVLITRKNGGGLR